MNNSPISLWDAVRRADRASALQRVARLRSAFPDATNERLHRLLVRNKCLQAGAVGALTAITGAIPGIGRVASFALGPLADTALVSALQAELVIEIFALYEMDLPEHGERVAILAIAATNLGADEIARQASRWLANNTGRWIGARWLKRAWPIANIGTSAATNIAVTYAIGNRTQALCKMRDVRVSNWPDLFRRVALIEPEMMMRWAGTAARTAMDQATESARTWTQRIGAFMPDLDGLLPPATTTRKEIAGPQKPRRKKALIKQAVSKKPSKASAARKATKTVVRKSASKRASSTPQPVIANKKRAAGTRSSTAK